MTLTLAPEYGHLDLNPLEPRIWLGGPSENCWRMYYNRSLLQWELEGGNGLVLYTQSSTFNCAGANVFDVLLKDLTLQAPSSVTVFPLSPLPCVCPSFLDPEQGELNLTPFPPTLHSHLGPTMGALSLTPRSPKVSTVTLITSTCCPAGLPETLTVTVSGTDCTCLNGTYTLTYAVTDPYPSIDLAPGWFGPAMTLCGAPHPLRWQLKCDPSTPGHPHWVFYLRYESGFGITLPKLFTGDATCVTAPLDGSPFTMSVPTSGGSSFPLSGCPNPSVVTLLLS